MEGAWVEDQSNDFDIVPESDIESDGRDFETRSDGDAHTLAGRFLGSSVQLEAFCGTGTVKAQSSPS